MSMNSSVYPYDEIKRLSEECRNVSITQFAKLIKERFYSRVSKNRFAVIPFPGQPQRLFTNDEIDIESMVFNIAATNLTAFLLRRETQWVYPRLLDWAAQTKDDFIIDTITTLVSRIKGEDEDSIISIVHLAYYQIAFFRIREISDAPIILPDTTVCQLLLKLAKQAVEQLSDQKNIGYRAGFDGGYTERVTRGEVDFITDEAVWSMRFWPGLPSAVDYVYLLTAYVIAKKSHWHHDRPLRFIRVMNPVDGITYSANVEKIDPMLLRIIDDCIYGKAYGNPSLMVLSPSQKSRLVMSMVRLMDSRDCGSAALAEEVQLLCKMPDDQAAAKKHLVKLLHNHFMLKWSVDKLPAMHRKSVLLLNELFYYLDYPDAPMGLTVTLSEETINAVLKKALAY